MAQDQVSEFGWGGGLHAPLDRGAPLSAYDRLRATRLTDPANPEASEDDVWSATVTQSHSLLEDESTDEVWATGTLRPGVTAPVTESGPIPAVGQHRIIDPGRYNKAKGGRSAHESDGYQDGSGREWRESVPENPVL